MAIEQSEYYYKILETDSLTIIADKHGLTPVKEWARKIWEDEKNLWMHTESDRYGKKSTRYLHIGNNKYERYDHSRYQEGYRGYDDPHQIIFYEGEKLWIPAKEETERIIHEMTDDELINGFVPEFGKKYRLIFPAMKVQLAMEDGTYSEDDKYTLYGYDNKGELIYKRTLVIKDDAVDNGGIKELIFQATPKCLKYTLDITSKVGDNKKEETRTLKANAAYI
jgi:hypothetical protein